VCDDPEGVKVGERFFVADDGVWDIRSYLCTVAGYSEVGCKSLPLERRGYILFSRDDVARSEVELLDREIERSMKHIEFCENLKREQTQENSE